MPYYPPLKNGRKTRVPTTFARPLPTSAVGRRVRSAACLPWERSLKSNMLRAASTAESWFFAAGVAISDKLQINVFHSGRIAYRGEFDVPVEIGRQDVEVLPPEIPFQPIPKSGYTRLVIAENREASIGRHQLRVERTRQGYVRLSNTGTQNALRLEGRANLAVGQSEEYPTPLTILFHAEKSVRITAAAETDLGLSASSILQSLPYRSFAPGSLNRSRLDSENVLFGRSAGVEQLGLCLEAILEVLQSASSSRDFYRKAARALVEVVRFDHGAVVMRQGGWKVAARFPEADAGEVEPWTPSVNRMLRRLENELTAIAENIESQNMVDSLSGVQTVAVAPILNRHGELVGALYGDRRAGLAAGEESAVSTQQLVIIHLLASGVANGLARIEEEEKAGAAHRLLEQFFGGELAADLASNAEMLVGKDAEVTLLFCDIRGFSSVSQRLGAEQTMAWISDVLTELSACVLAEQGVIVDFIGDELFAMWGAPKAQPDHALRACRAAMAMIHALQKIDERWMPIVAQPTQVGIGINSGTARVGNTGSAQRFKYGALGPDVNLASRIRGATKYLKTDLLITDSTKRLIGTEFPTRRLCDVEVINIKGAVTVHELWARPPQNWQELLAQYEAALRMFENKEFRDAARALGQLFTKFADDGPSMMLLSRAVGCVVDPHADSGAVWKLPAK
jgi:adenylate cyclase